MANENLCWCTDDTGDSVHVNDVNTAGSDTGTFADPIKNLFNSLDTTFSSTGHSSPAYFQLKLNEPIENDGIKICSPPGKSFSNVKIIIYDRAGTELDIIDYSTDSTQVASNDYRWRLTSWCSIRIEFHTTNDININWASLEKSVNVSLPAKFISLPNSSTTPLVGDAEFTGDWVRTDDYVQAIIDVNTDQDSATDGLKIELSDDGVNVRHTHTFTTMASSPTGHHYPSALELKYMRVRFVNGSITQTTFQLFTTMLPSAVEDSHAHGLDYQIQDDHPAPIVRNVNTAKKPNGDYTNIQATTGGNLKISVEEYDDASNPVRSDLEGKGFVTVGITAVQVTFTGTPTYSIIISSSPSNTGIIYIGESNVTSAGANAFAFIQAGDSLVIDYNDDINAIYVVSDTASQQFMAGALL